MLSSQVFTTGIARIANAWGIDVKPGYSEVCFDAIKSEFASDWQFNEVVETILKFHESIARMPAPSVFLKHLRSVEGKERADSAAAALTDKRTQVFAISGMMADMQNKFFAYMEEKEPGSYYQDEYGRAQLTDLGKSRAREQAPENRKKWSA